RSSAALERRIASTICALVARMPVYAACIALPDLDRGAGDRLSGEVEHATLQQQYLAHRFRVLAMDLHEIVVDVAVPVVRVERTFRLRGRRDEIGRARARLRLRHAH